MHTIYLIHNLLLSCKQTLIKTFFLAICVFSNLSLGKLKNAFRYNRIIVCCWTWKLGENLKRKIQKITYYYWNVFKKVFFTRFTHKHKRTHIRVLSIHTTPAHWNCYSYTLSSKKSAFKTLILNITICTIYKCISGLFYRLAITQYITLYLCIMKFGLLVKYVIWDPRVCPFSANAPHPNRVAQSFQLVHSQRDWHISKTRIKIEKIIYWKTHWFKIKLIVWHSRSREHTS